MRNKTLNTDLYKFHQQFQSKAAGGDIIARIDYCTSWGYESKAKKIFAELQKLVPELNLVASFNPDGRPKKGELKAHGTNYKLI